MPKKKVFNLEKYITWLSIAYDLSYKDAILHAVNYGWSFLIDGMTAEQASGYDLKVEDVWMIEVEDDE